MSEWAQAIRDAFDQHPRGFPISKPDKGSDSHLPDSVANQDSEKGVRESSVPKQEL
jgi:hypothetical protein